MLQVYRSPASPSIQELRSLVATNHAFNRLWDQKPQVSSTGPSKDVVLFLLG